MPVAVIDEVTGSFNYVHSNNLGTPQKITNGSAANLWTANYQPFGATTPTGTFSQNLRLPGQYFDAESGLNQNGFRDYQPTFGRYVESDPIGLNGGINTYGYVEQNPLKWKDFNGLCPVNSPDCIDAIYPIEAVVSFIYGGPVIASARTTWNLMKNDSESSSSVNGLPPENILPPIKNATSCKIGPASRSGDTGKSLYDPNGGEWRYSPEDKWHNTHWDYNPWSSWNSKWENITIDGKPPLK